MSGFARYCLAIHGKAVNCLHFHHNVIANREAVGRFLAFPCRCVSLIGFDRPTSVLAGFDCRVMVDC
jgi:hypothetical protein